MTGARLQTRTIFTYCKIHGFSKIIIQSFYRVLKYVSLITYLVSNDNFHKIQLGKTFPHSNGNIQDFFQGTTNNSTLLASSCQHRYHHYHHHHCHHHRHLLPTIQCSECQVDYGWQLPMISKMSLRNRMAERRGRQNTCV